MDLPAPARRLPDDPASTVRCPTVEASSVRCLVSPMHTAVALLFEIIGGWRRGADERWVGEALERARGIDLEAFAIFAAPERILADTLLPVPERSGPTWAPALAAVAAGSAEATRADLLTMLGGREPSPGLRPWLDDTAAALARYAAALDAWWERVLAPQWPQMLSILEIEVLRIGRLLATDGHEATLAAVHPRVGWAKGALHLPSALPADEEVALGDRVVVLLPMACGRDGVMCGKDDPKHLTIAYAAPGTAALYHAADADPVDPLAATIGAGRAAVLRAMDGPRSLRVLGMHAGLAVSTVHSHLQALVRAGLAQSGRVGKQVVYTRSPRGEQLVGLF